MNVVPRVMLAIHDDGDGDPRLMAAARGAGFAPGQSAGRAEWEAAYFADPEDDDDERDGGAFPLWTDPWTTRAMLGGRLALMKEGAPLDWSREGMALALALADDVSKDALATATETVCLRLRVGGAVGDPLAREWARVMGDLAGGLLGALTPVAALPALAAEIAAWLDRRAAGWDGHDAAAVAREEAAELRVLVDQVELPGAHGNLAMALLRPDIILARLAWAAGVRAGWEKRRKEEAPRFLAASLPLDLHKHVTRPPRALVAPGVDGWTLAPSLPAAVLDLPALSMSGGRAVLRQIPSVARGAALRDGEMVVLWENGAHRVTAEALTGMTTLLRAESAHSPNEALRAWLGLAHDADPWGALDLLTRLPLTWTTARGGSLNGPLVFEAKRIGGSATCQLSSALHPAVAGGMVGAVLVPVLPTLPPTWHPNAARLGDAFEHALMRELAMRAPGATEDGPLLDIDLVLAGESDGRLHERKGERLTFLRRLGLDGPDGCPGLWTGGVPGAERRWLVSNGRYLPADPDAAAMLKEGWAIRKGAVVGGRKSAAARKKRRGD